MPKLRTYEDRERVRLVAERVARDVAEVFGVEAVTLLGPGHRHDPLAPARHLALWLAVEVTGASLLDIGQAFGGISDKAVALAFHKTDAKVARKEARIMLDLRRFFAVAQRRVAA